MSAQHKGRTRQHTSFADTARGLGSRIVLIDGTPLTALMIEHNVGVSTHQVFAIKALDSDYFSEE